MAESNGTKSDRKPFVLDAVQQGVTQPRATATSTAIYQQQPTSETGAPSFAPVVVSSSLQISFDASEVENDSTMNKAETRPKIANAYDIFCQIAKRSVGQQFLKEIADFPNNLVFETEPGGATVAQINQQIAATVPKVKKIEVIFTATLPTPGDVGDHDPVVPASSYKIWVLVKADDTKSGPRQWPGLPNCSPDIKYTHKKSESQMVVTLFHELVHIWFVYKYWVWGGSSNNNLGHETYTPCSGKKPFFTEVLKADNTQFPGNGLQPFFERLRPFYQEVDTIESTRPVK